MAKSFSAQSFIPWMAWRNLVSRKRRSGLSFLTTVSIFGVAIAVMTLIVVLSVMGGFEQDLKSKLLHGEPHAEIQNKKAAVGFSLNQYPVKKFQELIPDATEMQPFIKVDAVLKHRKHLQHAILYGVNAKSKNGLWVFNESMVEGKLRNIHKLHTPLFSETSGKSRWPGIVLGEQLAGNLGVNIGDEITIINPQAAVDSNSALSGGTTIRHYVLAGVFRSGSMNYDAKWAVVSIPEARRFMPDYDKSLDEEKYVSGIALSLKDPFHIDNLKDSLKEFKDLEIQSWQEANKALLFALKLEKFAMGSILMLIVVVAAFSISGTMMMTVYHKRQHISLLRAIGMSRSEIMRLYLSHGFAIGSVGIAIGLAFGLSICYFIFVLNDPNNPLGNIINLPAGVYYIKRWPVKFLPEEYFVICLFAWIFSVVAAMYPAMTAAKHDPSAGLRYE